MLRPVRTLGATAGLHSAMALFQNGPFDLYGTRTFDFMLDQAHDTLAAIPQSG